MTRYTLDTARLSRVGDWMQGYIDARKYAGCSMLVRQSGQEVYFAARGKRDLASGAPFERDTVARVYSMTKPVTTVALMSLVERGLVYLEAPVSEYLPEFSDMRCLIPDAASLDQTEPCPAPTLHQLLTHTSGMSYDFNPGLVSQEMARLDVRFGPDRADLAEMVTRAASLPLAFRPGARWEYSVGLDIIGRVVEVVAGKPLGEVFEELIFDPLGMSETAFSVPKGAADRFAALYTPLQGNHLGLHDATRGAETLRLAEAADGSPYHAPSLEAGGGGLVGTIDDYMTFCEMLRQGGAIGDNRVLSPSTVAFMMRNHLPGDIASMGPESFAEQPMEGMGFGLGGSVVLDPGRVRMPGSVGDFSWGGIASTFFWIDPVHDLSVVFFTQLSPSSSYPARAQLKGLVHGALS